MQGGVAYTATLGTGIATTAGAHLHAYSWTFAYVAPSTPAPTPNPIPSPSPTPTPGPTPPSSGSGSPDAQGCWNPALSCLSLAKHSRANGSLYATYRNNCSARLLAKVCIQQSTGGQFCSGSIGVPAGGSVTWDGLNGTGSSARFTGSNNPNNDILCANRSGL